VWVAFHGLGVDHDRQINRTGAFTETCLAVQRVHSVGLRAGANVFLTTDNTPLAERLLGVLQRLEIDQMWWGPATDYPTARGRRNERLRPALSELLPLAGRIRTLSPFDHGVWANLEAPHRGGLDASRAGRRLATLDAPRRRGPGAGVPPNLDLHTGTAGWYRQRHGNLRTDDPQAALAGALQQGGRSHEALWFGPEPLPSVAELAVRHGDPNGQWVHFSPESGSGSEETLVERIAGLVGCLAGGVDDQLGQGTIGGVGHKVSVPVKAHGWGPPLGQDPHGFLWVRAWQQQGEVADMRQGGPHPSEQGRVLLDGVTSSQVDHRVLVVSEDALDGVGLQRLPRLIGGPHISGLFRAL
jgi:hypothetical protein